MIEAIIHLWQLHTAVRFGSAVKTVDCERCQQRYLYLMKRIVKEGRPIRRWAENKANKVLERALSQSCDVVPCPRCGWIQTAMVQKLRRMIGRKVPALIHVLAFFWWVPLVIGFWTAGGRDPAAETWVLGWGIAAGALLLAAVLLFIWHHVSAAKTDPNVGNAEPRIAEGKRRALRHEAVAARLNTPSKLVLEFPGGKLLARQLNPNLVPDSWARVIQPRITESTDAGGATLTGRVVREVECESCGEEYVYVLERTRQWHPRTLPSIQTRIAESLAKELKTDFDYVPCPSCGWYQSAMVEDDLKEKKDRSKLRVFVSTGVVLFDGGLCLSPCVPGITSQVPPPYQWLVLPISLFILPLATWIVLEIDLHQQLKQDLNSRDVEKRIKKGKRLARLRSEVVETSGEWPGDQA